MLTMCVVVARRGMLFHREIYHHTLYSGHTLPACRAPSKRKYRDSNPFPSWHASAIIGKTSLQPKASSGRGGCRLSTALRGVADMWVQSERLSANHGIAFGFPRLVAAAIGERCEGSMAGRVVVLLISAARLGIQNIERKRRISTATLRDKQDAIDTTICTVWRLDEPKYNPSGWSPLRLQRRHPRKGGVAQHEPGLFI